MSSWWGEGAGFRIALVEAVDIHPAVVDVRPTVVADVAGVACAGPPCLVAAGLIIHHCIGDRYVASSPSASPFLKMSVDGNLPAVGIVAIAGDFVAVPAISVFVPLVVSAIDSGGGKGGPIILLFWCRPVICCACICAWCGCCVCMAFISGPPWPIDAI